MAGAEGAQHGGAVVFGRDALERARGFVAVLGQFLGPEAFDFRRGGVGGQTGQSGDEGRRGVADYAGPPHRSALGRLGSRVLGAESVRVRLRCRTEYVRLGLLGPWYRCPPPGRRDLP